MHYVRPPLPTDAEKLDQAASVLSEVRPLGRCDTKHVYFYLPRVRETSGADKKQTETLDIGSILRLGGYCELEANAGKIKEDAEHYYPEQHIKDEGGFSSANIYKHAAGNPALTSHGILLSCDGRFLVKAGEKMYLETGDWHQHVKGRMEIEVNGQTDLHSTGDVKIGSGESVTIESGKDKDFLIRAGEGEDGHLKLKGLHKSEEFGGNRWEMIHRDSCEMISGTSIEMFAGARAELVASASIALSLSGIMELRSGVVIEVVGVEVKLKGIEYTNTAWDLNDTEVAFHNHAADIDNAGIRARSAAIGSEEEAVQAHYMGVASRSANLEARLLGLDVSVVGSFQAVL